MPRDSLSAEGSFPRIGLSLTDDVLSAVTAEAAAAGAATLLLPSPLFPPLLPAAAAVAAAAAGAGAAAEEAAAMVPVHACTSSTGGILESTWDATSHASVCPRLR